MKENVPSRTALRVALRRAGHQILDAAPRVLDDPLAVRIVGPAVQEIYGDPQRHNSRIGRTFRAFMVARSRFAEDQLAEAIAGGTTQYLILGAGLDTSAYRGICTTAEIRVFEVDHPATQDWKQMRLREAGIPVPGNVRHVAVDFENEDLAERLAVSGFQEDERTLVSWLGVVPYLTRAAAAETLRFLGRFPAGSGVVFDYAVAKSALGFFERIALDTLARRVAKAGEPFRLYFEPEELDEFLRERGFSKVEQLGSQEINERYFAARRDGLKVAGGAGRIVAAWV